MTRVVTISLDFELAWGSFDVANRADVLRCARWTHDEGVPLLLEVLARYGIPATWATVGAVARDGLTLADRRMEEVSYPWMREGWLAPVPFGVGEADAPEWFAPRLVDRIQESAVGHEVGFHGHTHVLFGHPGTPQGRKEQELLACREVAAERGIEGGSFVFPRNSIGALDAMSRLGFSTYRDVDWLDGSRRLARRSSTYRSVVSALSDVAARAPRIVEPSMCGEMVAQPGSMMLRYPAGWRGRIPDSFRSRRLQAGLASLAARGGQLHVWFHPVNLYYGHPRMLTVFESFLRSVRDGVEQDTWEVLTMGRVADRVRAGEW